MNIRKFLDDRISRILEEAGGPQGSPAIIGPSRRPELGDYQANGAMAAAKKIGSNPRELAGTTCEKIKELEPISAATVAGPGFINISLDNSWLGEKLAAALSDPQLGISKTTNPKTVVVDYSHPNLAKEMHVGHLRSTIIGDSLVRVLEFLGHMVIRHNHVGDWGTQFGMLIAYLARIQKEGGETISRKLADLEEFYRQAKKLFDSEAKFAQEAREYVVRLQGGDPQCLQVWKEFISESLRHCEEIYTALGITLKPEDVVPESFYNPDLGEVINDLDRVGLLTESDGALCVFIEQFIGKDGAPLPALVKKSDGGYLYATTDLAAIRYRAGKLEADRILYIVDARQTLHLKQVFSIARAAGFAPKKCALEHHSFGTMMGADGKPFKTRDGGTIKLIELIREARQRAYQLVNSKNPTLNEDEKLQIAQVVGIGAIKYADLAQNRTSDYLFNWDKMLSLEGNTAPYMQYAYARIKSIFRKGGINENELAGPIELLEGKERSLALKLLQFEEVVVMVARDCLPNMLCTYLYELAQLFMSFYEACPVLKAPEPRKTYRLRLCLLTAKTIKTGLHLLGIETIDKM